MACRYLARDHERLLVLALLRIHVPECEPGAMEVRRQAKRFLEECDLCGGSCGDRALDELLERRERRMPALHVDRRHVRVRQNPAWDFREDPEEIGEWAALRHFGEPSAGIETDGPRADGQLP